jgi:uncharacterized protein (TIGR02678 family)
MKPASGEVSEVSRLSEEERQAALRAVLRRPLLIAERADHREDFAKVRRHAEPLRAWFARHTGWTLEVDAECARLYKVPARLDDATHPAFLAKDELPFTRRRYVLLCIALAVLVKSESQTTLGRLAYAIVELWKENAAFAGLVFDLDAVDSRRDLIAAVRLLAEYHAITQVDGDEQRFLHHREQEVLYDVHHHIIFRLLAARRAPSAIQEREWSARLEALVAEPAIDEEEQRNQRIRHHLGRRLLDDPMLYSRDLPDDAHEYFLKQRPHILQALVDATDLEPEDRRDGIALADRLGDCTDIGLPEEGTDGHATLLTAEYLGTLRLDQPGDIVPFALVEQFLAAQAQKNRGFWRKDATASGSEVMLAREVIRRLASLDLVRRLPDGVVVMPAIHRYRHELRTVATGARPTEN